MPDTSRDLTHHPFVPILLRGIGVFALVGGLSSFLSFLEITSPKLGLSLAWWIVIALWLWLACEYLIFWYARSGQPSPNPNLVAASIHELELLFSQGKYSQILRLREALSRYLWVEGQLRERVRLGEIAERAAFEDNDLPSRLAALIDDLGWTSVALRDHTRAEESIRHGLGLAIEAQELYWVAKAHRHMAGLYTIKRNFSRAYEEMELARQAASKLPVGKQRTEMLAGIEYGVAVTYLLEGKYEMATQHTEASERLRLESKDPSRLVRIHALKGKIALAQGHLAQAKDLFLKGLREAERVGRKDEVIRNHIGLTHVFKQQNQLRQASEHQEAARQLLCATPVPYEVEDEDSYLSV